MSKKPGQRRRPQQNRKPAARAGATGPTASRGPAAAGGAAANRSAARPPVANGTTTRTPQAAQSNANLILLAGFSAAVLLFWYYHLLTLNQMTDLTGGLAVPDQLFGGYDVAHIEALRANMDDAARGQLNYLHKTAGLLFPLFLALITMLAVNIHVARGALRWCLWAVPMLFAVLDLWENSAIDGILAGAVDPGAVALASALTIARWIMLIGTVGVAGFVLVRAFVSTFRKKWADAGLA